MDDRILSALDYIRPDELSYDEWLNVGMALHSEDYPCEVWDNWSKPDARYESGLCAKKWAGFHKTEGGITGGTIIDMAKKRGWEYFDLDGCLDWDSEIEDDGDGFTEARWDQTGELIKYLETLFEPDEYVGIVNEAAEHDGKWNPANAGYYDRTAAQLIDSLKKYPDSIDNTIGTWNDKAGAWIRFNPLKDKRDDEKKTVTDKDVTAFRYTVVESDTMGIQEQEDFYRRAQIPVAAMVFSGGKSVHAIVKINAEDRKQYEERIKYLYKYLADNGFECDKQNRNPSRMSRIPGVTRNGRHQHLICTNIGAETWDEWVAIVEGDALPPIVNLRDYIDKIPEQPPEQIEGILRHGHKMLVSGPSKAGKSMLLMNLGISIAEGLDWLGFQCQQGKVLYINLEIDHTSTINRFHEIYEARGLSWEGMSENLDVWSLRGQAMPLDKLVPILIKKISSSNLDALILDPIYKVITGDENSATDMGMFCNQFDRICNALGCSTIYCHHHSKGAQGNKKAMDRASGSGVFARDPDAQLDLAPLVLTRDIVDNVRDGFDTGWRIESNLREFRNIEPLNVWFSYPIHIVDQSGELEHCHVEGASQSTDPDVAEIKRNKTAEKIIAAFNDCRDGDIAKMTDVAKSAGINIKTVYRYIDEDLSDYFERKNDGFMYSATDENW